MVAEADQRAEDARAILRRTGIGIHDPVNLLPLRTEVHQGLHTDAYYQSVNTAITTAYGTGGRPAVKVMLNIIKTRLLATGTYP